MSFHLITSACHSCLAKVNLSGGHGERVRDCVLGRSLERRKCSESTVFQGLLLLVSLPNGLLDVFIGYYFLYLPPCLLLTVSYFLAF